jgi:glycosyltransferase involved in cell wall biosynthesis
MALPRVLIIHPALAPYRIDLFNALARRLDLKIVFLHEDVPYQAYDQAELRNRLDVDFEFRSERYSVLGLDCPWAVADEVRKSAAEVVITHEFSAASWMVALRKRSRSVRQIVWSADNLATIADESLLRSTSRRLLLPHLDGLILYSQAVADHYSRKLGYRGPIGISCNAQSDRSLRARVAASADAASHWVRERDLKGKKVLLSVGRLARAKRHDRLIRAFANLCDRMRDVVLVLVGDGEERGRLEDLARARGIEGRVLFTGHLEGERLFAWYALAACFALTSEFEPWGAVVNEALAAGVPVICSDRAGASEWIVDASIGSVVDASDEGALTDCLVDRLRGGRVVAGEAPDSLRDSLMPQVFERSVEGFLDPIRALVGTTLPDR